MTCSTSSIWSYTSSAGPTITIDWDNPELPSDRLMGYRLFSWYSSMASSWLPALLLSWWGSCCCSRWFSPASLYSSLRWLRICSCSCDEATGTISPLSLTLTRALSCKWRKEASACFINVSLCLYSSSRCSMLLTSSILLAISLSLSASASRSRSISALVLLRYAPCFRRLWELPLTTILMEERA